MGLNEELVLCIAWAVLVHVKLLEWLAMEQLGNRYSHYHHWKMFQQLH